MPSNTDVARELYRAFERADPKLLLEMLHPDFVGHASEGMPGGLGGTHVGPEAMLTEVWRRPGAGSGSGRYPSAS